MNIEVKQITQYANSPELPSNEKLIENYHTEYPFTQKEKIKTYAYQNNTYIYHEIGSDPIFIDRHRENCLLVENRFEIEFTPKDKGAIHAGYCKILIEPISEKNSIIINKTFQKRAKYLESINKYPIEVESLKGLELLYSQYISQAILNYCDNYNIIESKFTIVDLIHHPIDTSPLKYGIFVKAYLKKAFEENRFIKIKNCA